MNSYHLKLYSVVFVSLLLIISLFGYTVISTNQYNDDSKVPAPDIEVTKEASSISGYPGSLITFTITVENTGFWELNPVDITDTLPSTMTYVSSSPPGTVSGNEITWTTDLLNWGESKTFELVASINWNAPTVLHNHVNATGISDVFPVFDEDTANVTVLNPIAIEKSVQYDSNGPWNDEGIVIDMAGSNPYDWVTFRINVTNLVDVPLNVTVEDVLPDGLINGDQYYPFDPDEVDGNSIFWYLDGMHHDLLNPDETKTFTLRAEMGKCDVNYVNEVFVTSRNGSSNPRVDTDNASVRWINCDVEGNISVTKSADPLNCAAGSNVTFTITVFNTGDCVLNPVTVVDTLPDEMSYVSDDSGGIEDPAGVISWDVGPLSIDESKTIHLVAHIDTDLSTSEEKNDYDQRSLLNGLPAIEVEKTVRLLGDSDWSEYVLADPGETVEFNVSIHNPYDNYTIHWSGDIMDTFPCNLEYVNGSMDDFPLHEHHGGEEVVDWVNKTVLWHPRNDQTVPPGEYLNFTYEAVVTCDCGTMIGYNNITVSPDFIISDDDVITNSDRGYPDGIPLNVSDSAQVGVICEMIPPDVLNNTVDVTALTPVGDSVTDSDYAEVTVINPDIMVTKSVNPTSAEPGTDVTFTITVSNTGDCILDPVMVTDTLPFGMSYVSDDSEGSVSSNQVIWDIGPLPVGSRTIRLVAHVDTYTVDVLNNTIEAIGLPPVGDPVSDSDYAEVVVSESMDVEQLIFDRGFPIRHAVDGDWAGTQSFIPILSTLSKIELYLKSYGTPEFDLTVELRENDPEGIILDTVTFPAGNVPSSWAWLEVDFDDVTVSSGTEYFIVIPPAPSGVTTSFGYEWGYAFGDMYPDGCFWFTRDGGSLWRDLPDSYEFTFKTFGYN